MRRKAEKNDKQKRYPQIDRREVGASIMKTKRAVLFAFLFMVILIFIWGNSSKNFTYSHQVSKLVTERINTLLESLVGSGHITDSIVRKLAHVAEYTVLGGVMVSFLAAKKRRGLQPVLNCLFIGLLVAVVDETIQIFSNRGSSVLDVLLDFSGVCVGALLACWIVSAICRK